MEEKYYGFDVGRVVIGALKLLKDKGYLDEEEVLDLLWESKDALFPWDRSDIKELIKL